MPDLGERFEAALALAARLHRRQKRKGTSVPYVSHLLGVCSIILEHGGGEVAACAALLHDAVEDQGGRSTLQTIAGEIGEDVAGIVAACSDAFGFPKPPWKERKLAYLARLPQESDEALLVSAADKLHNLRSVVAAHRLVGEQVWARFSQGRSGQLWYYREVIAVLRATGRVAAPLIGDLEREMGVLEALVASASPP